MNKVIKASLLFVLLPVTAVAQEKADQYNPVDYAVVSQTIAPDARAGGMGDVGAATDPDVNSQAWNPAKYPFNISRAGIAVNYTPWLRQLVNDIDQAYVAGYYRIGDYSAVAASFRYFSLGEVMMNDESTTINPYEMAIDASYSLMLSDKLSIAAALRYIYSDLRFTLDEDYDPASAFSADIALYYQNYLNIGSRECQLGLGLDISNIGSKITFGGDEHSQFLPTNLRLGASLMVPIDEYNRFSISADANKMLVPTRPTEQQYNEASDKDSYADYEDYLDKKYYNTSSISGIFKSFGDAPGGFKEELQEIQWCVGAEYVYHDQFSLRAGYRHQSENKGNLKYFTVGGGFRMSAFSLDAGYVIATTKSNPLDQTLRFTLTFDMDGIKDLFRRR